MYMQFIESLGLPAWMVPVFVVMIALSALTIYRATKRTKGQSQLDHRVQEVRAKGVPATAMVLQATDTGVRRGNNLFIVVALRLAVQPGNGGKGFETTIDAPISPVRLPDFAEGKQIDVMIDVRTREVAVAQRVL
jgi:hypothetical protein